MIEREKPKKDRDSSKSNWRRQNGQKNENYRKVTEAVNRQKN